MTSAKKNSVYPSIIILLLLWGILIFFVNPVGEFMVSATLPELLGEESASRFEGVVEPDEAIEWQVYVPESYDREAPAGLMVYISPMDSGEIPGRWKEVMDAGNLIWIGANKSGNRIRVARRVT